MKETERALAYFQISETKLGISSLKDMQFFGVRLIPVEIDKSLLASKYSQNISKKLDTTIKLSGKIYLLC